MLVASPNHADQNVAEPTVKDVYDSREIRVNRFVLDQSAGLTPCHEAETAKLAIATLSHIVSKLPTQTRRTIEQEQFQQFSTPPHYAYAAAWVANLSDKDVVLEPSAGVGGILVFAMNSGATCFANELSPRRAALLEELAPDVTVFRENAEHLNDLLPEYVRPTVCILNPPFSATAGRMGDQKVRETANIHLEQALLRLEPNGRMVAIVGGGLSLDARSHYEWWSRIRAKYTVRANVLVPGREYAKYGTTFDTRIIVIDKCGPTSDAPVSAAVESVADLIDVLMPVRELRGKESNEPRELQLDFGPVAEPPAEPGATRAAVQNDRRRRVVRSPKATPVPATEKPAPVYSKPVIDRIVVNPVDGVTACAMIGGVFEKYEPKRFVAPGARKHPTPLVESGAMASVLPPPITYRPYLPQSMVDSGIVSEAQLEAVIYAGQAFEQMLGAPGSAKQVRRGYCIGDSTGLGKGREQCAIILDDWFRRGENGVRKAVWVSKNQKLLADARRDWSDVGGDPDDVIPLSDYKLGDKIDRAAGVLFVTYDTLKSGAKSDDGLRKVKPADFDSGWNQWNLRKLCDAVNNPNQDTLKVVQAIRNQGGDYEGMSVWQAMQAVDPSLPSRSGWDDPFPPVSRELVMTALGLDIESLRPAKSGANRPSRLDQVKEWLGDDFDGVICFDEAHQARNSLDD